MPGIGVVRNGSRSWFGIGGFGIILLTMVPTLILSEAYVNIYQADDFVHACLEDNISRTPETVDLFYEDPEAKNTGINHSYKVRRGKSLLYDAYKIWREKALLESAALLNRITRSSIVRKVGVEVGDMPKEQVQATLRRVKEMMEQKGAKFMSIISNNAYINQTATIGDGSFVAGWSCVSDNVVLGKHSIVHVFCDLGHDAKVGDYSSIEAYSFLGGYSEVGQESVMHVRSTLIRHKKIGSQVSVGSSSVVMRNVKDGLHVFGNPAQKIDY